MENKGTEIVGEDKQRYEKMLGEGVQNNRNTRVRLYRGTGIGREG